MEPESTHYKPMMTFKTGEPDQQTSDYELHLRPNRIFLQLATAESDPDLIADAENQLAEAIVDAR